jgi:hypothetical protein
MAEDPVGSLLCRLYELCILKANDKGGNRIAKGHIFEDETAEQVYYFAREVGLDPYPPRMTLELPTLSGNFHQFDASFRYEHDIFVVECKNTKQAAKDYLYYFNAKIMDYIHSTSSNELFSFRGIFLSTVPVSDSAWKYGLAYGLRIIDPDSPPPEYMISNNQVSTFLSLARNVVEKMKKLSEGSTDYSPQRVLEDYRYLCGRWNNGR